MKIRKTFLIFLLSSFLAAGCLVTTTSNIQYYDSKVSCDSLEEAFRSQFVVKTVFYTAQGAEVPIKAKSTHIGDGYLLILTHCCDNDIEASPDLARYVGLNATKRYFIDEKELEWVGKIDDVTLLYADWLKEYPTSPAFGDSDNLKVGNEVFVYGYSNGLVFNFKRGEVSCVDMETMNEDYKQYYHYGNLAFVISIPLNSGDSGSPVFALHDGELEIIGVVVAGWVTRMAGQSQGLCFALRSNFVKKCIEKIKLGEPLEVEKESNEIIKGWSDDDFGMPHYR